MKGYLQTVTGSIPKEEMGLTLPHEHLFNDLSSVVDKPFYSWSEQIVGSCVCPEKQ